MMMIWTTTYDKTTGKPRATTPPDVPEEYREFLFRDGWFYANFIPHDGDHTNMSADALVENYMEDWDAIDWDNCFHKVDEDDREDYKEEYENWKKAMGWFAENGFDAVWWW